MGKLGILTLKVDKGKFDDFSHVLAVFRLLGAPQEPLRVPNGFQWTT